MNYPISAPLDPALAENLVELILSANEIGAEGIFLIRGAKDAMLTWTAEAEDDDTIANIPTLALKDAGLLVLMRFPASDGGVEGIESR